MTQPERHVLAVLAHPWRDSLTAKLLARAVDGLEAAGHTVETADLYREGFEPLLGEHDYAQFENRPMPEDVRREQARVDGADALVFAFPVWWWSFPAMLKGWFDRVWSQDWAYDFTPERSRGLLRPRPVLLLCVAGSRRDTYKRYGYDRAIVTQIEVGVLGYAGLTDVRAEFFYDVDDDRAARAAHLERAYIAGATFLLAAEDPLRRNPAPRS